MLGRADAPAPRARSSAGVKIIMDDGGYVASTRLQMLRCLLYAGLNVRRRTADHCRLEPHSALYVAAAADAAPPTEPATPTPPAAPCEEMTPIAEACAKSVVIDSAKKVAAADVENVGGNVVTPPPADAESRHPGADHG